MVDRTEGIGPRGKPWPPRTPRGPTPRRRVTNGGLINVSASNRITSHGQRFHELRTPRGPSTRRRVRNARFVKSDASKHTTNKSWNMVSRVANAQTGTLEISRSRATRRLGNVPTRSCKAPGLYEDLTYVVSVENASEGGRSGRGEEDL